MPFDYARHGQWVHDLLNPTFCDDTKGIVAEIDGKPVGVMLLDQWTETSAQCHVGLTNAMCLKRLPYEFANYFFNTCDKEILIGLTPADNKKAIKINKHFGFKEVYRMKDAYKKGIDYIVYRMERDDCPFLIEKEEAA